MTAKHQRIFSDDDRATYAALGESLARAGTTRVELDRGEARPQYSANRCAAAACVNALETCAEQWGWDRDFPDPAIVYLAAREIDEYDTSRKGTTLQAAAEATCRLVGHGLRWMELPQNDPQILAAWIATEKTGIAFGTMWSPGDNHPSGRTRILRPSGAFSRDGHAVHLHGFDAKHAYRPRWWSPAKKTEAMFLVENSHQFPEITFFYPAARVASHALSAVVFVPPHY